MAYTEIHPVKSTLGKAIAYICDPGKTDEKILISSFGCSCETADIEFQFTLAQTKMRKGSNLAHHLIQAFDPGETTPEQAHEIGKKLADMVTGGQYEYVIATHIDKGHVHNHILFCAASFITQTKYNSNKRTYFAIRNANDKLCREYGLSTIIPSSGQQIGRIEYTDECGKRVTRPAQKWAQSWTENDAAQRGASWKVRLREAIDHYISAASDFEDMLRRMEADGYSIKRAKYHSYKLPGADEHIRYTGGPSLGPEYTDDRIRERIAARERAPSRGLRIQRQDPDRINLLIDIENNMKAQQSAAYSASLKIVNLKEAAKTVNYLTEHNILHYDELLAKIDEVSAANDSARDSLRQVEQRIGNMGLLIKHVNAYRRTKSVYDQYQQAKDKALFRRQQEKEITMHEVATRALKTARGHIGTKLPILIRSKKTMQRLTSKKTACSRSTSSWKSR